MRCNNCGWENPDHLTKCEKCNSPLGGGISYQPVQSFGTAREQGAGGYENPLKQTVGEGVVFGSNNVQLQQEDYQTPFSFPQQSKPRVCPNCGYPLREGVSVCPNCHNGQVKVDAGVKQKSEPAPQKQVSSVQGTVNPWMQAVKLCKCRLEPIPVDGMDTPDVVEIKGDKNDLNRSILDPDNMTITSQVQASLTCEDGTWYIEDKSSQHTTFVRAGSKMSISEGDVILMGNRQFIFHCV